MAYTKQTWANDSGGGTPISAARLQHMEDGIEAAGGGTVDVQTHAATSKATPVDADEFPMADSAASFGLKKTSLASIKTALAAWLTTLAATWTNKTLTAPRIDRIQDTNGNSVLLFSPTASAVNYAQIQNTAAGNGNVNYRVTGADANIHLNMITQGTGVVKANNVEVMTLNTIHALTAKTSPTDSNELVIVDTDAANVLKKLSIGDLKTLIVALIVNSAPGTLDTLDELAAALGDDANFAATITAALALKAPLASPTLTTPTLATPALTGSAKVATSGQLEIHNQADQTTNYERLLAKWDTNVCEIKTNFGGTGVTRTLRIGVAGIAGNEALSKYLEIKNSAAPHFTTAGTSSFTGTYFQVAGTLNGSSGVQSALGVNNIINQSGTAGYNGLLVNLTETSTGSGAKKLADFQVGGASKASVDNAGVITSGKAVTGSRPTAASAGQGGMFYDTTLGKPIWSDGTNWKDAAGTTV